MNILLRWLITPRILLFMSLPHTTAIKKIYCETFFIEQNGCITSYLSITTPINVLYIDIQHRIKHNCFILSFLLLSCHENRVTYHVTGYVDKVQTRCPHWEDEQNDRVASPSGNHLCPAIYQNINSFKTNFKTKNVWET